MDVLSFGRMGTQSLNGFLQHLLPISRASLMLDVVFVSMLIVVPTMWWSIYLVRSQRRYGTHKRIQLALGVVLLVVLVLFETDIRMHGWRDRTVSSPYATRVDGPSWVDLALRLHLVFAVSTVALWIAVITQALRHFPMPARPNEHSRWHQTVGKLAAYDMTLTAITGWLFYYLAFVAT